jgi:hypothetical protein
LEVSRMRVLSSAMYRPFHVSTGMGGVLVIR